MSCNLMQFDYFYSAHYLRHPVTLQGHLHTCAATIQGQLIFFGETCRLTMLGAAGRQFVQLLLLTLLTKSD